MEAVERVGQNTTYQSHGKHERGSETARRSVWIHFVISRSGVRVRLPAPSFRFSAQVNMGEFPSGQRGQTVNLLSVTSVVRIHLPPPKQSQTNREVAWLCSYLCNLYGRRSLRFGLSARRGRIKKRLLHRIVPAR